MAALLQRGQGSGMAGPIQRDPINAEQPVPHLQGALPAGKGPVSQPGPMRAPGIALPRGRWERWVSGDGEGQAVGEGERDGTVRERMAESLGEQLNQ